MEQALRDTLALFIAVSQRAEINRAGTQLSITIGVSAPSYSGSSPTMQLCANFYDGKTYQDVRAASLKALMKEVYSRCAFEDREALEIDAVNTSLLAMPAPDPNDEL